MWTMDDPDNDPDRLQNVINKLKFSQRYLTIQRDVVILEMKEFRNEVQEFIFSYSDWKNQISEQRSHIDMLRRLLDNQNEFMTKHLRTPNPKVEGFRDICAVCLIREPDMVLDNCGHYIMCQVCVNSMSKKECPLCRRTFKKAIKVFQSCGSVEVPTISTQPHLQPHILP